MYRTALEYLACPVDGAALHPAAVEPADAEQIVGGALHCTACGRCYPIRDGIPNLLLHDPRFKSPAQFVNILVPTAWAYERFWRPRALKVLSGEAFGYERELPLISGLAAAQRGGLLLDVACSNGLYARTLERARRRAPGHCIGIDHSRPMLQQAHVFARRDRLPISFVQASAQALPIASGSATAVVMGGSLNEIGDAPRALAEMRRVLRPEGRCVQMNLVQADRRSGRVLQSLLAPGGLVFPSQAASNRFFQHAGLRVAAQWRYGVVLFSLLLPV
jgi:SAM-dependent methyltransferase